MGKDHEKVKSEALQIIGQHQNLPRLVVFDLDYTLWPFYCECCYENEMPRLYPQATGIFVALKEKGIDMVVASRSPTPDVARRFLQKLGIHTLFVARVKEELMKIEERGKLCLLAVAGIGSLVFVLIIHVPVTS